MQEPTRLCPPLAEQEKTCELWSTYEANLTVEQLHTYEANLTVEQLHCFSRGGKLVPETSYLLSVVFFF